MESERNQAQSCDWFEENQEFRKTMNNNMVVLVHDDYEHEGDEQDTVIVEREVHCFGTTLSLKNN